MTHPDRSIPMPGLVRDVNKDSAGSDADTEDLCAFCLDRIQNPEKLNCNHAFCKTCLEIYLEARNWVADRCPICRRSLGQVGVKQGQEVSDFRVPRECKNGWRLFGFMTLAMLMLSLGPFYLLLIYW